HDAFGCADAVPLPSPGGAPTDTLVAVATAPEAASQAGRAYAFRRAPDGQGGYIWTEEAVLRASPSGSGLNFGQSVAVYPGGEPSPGGVPGDPQQVRALVGTLSQEPSIQEAAFLFVRQPGGAWGQPARLTSGVPPPERLDFGFSVALSQTHAFVGAPATDLPGSPEVEEAGSVYVFGSPPTTSTEPEVPASPLTLSVSPNPARGAATVTLTLTRPSPVEVAVYDALGRRVAPLHDGPLAAGPHAFTVRRAALPPGVYFVRARGEGASASRPLTVLR
ncbi:MAG TPA: T9SS type A sorting domain-containing protein, partial [Rubricoccaceae bacterium]|nr:T9SS type A sorting domain-containing protein [Rubricoccaceae bacterium]